MIISATFSSYEHAMEHADGYEDELLTKVVVAKGKKFSEDILATRRLDLMSLRTFVGLASLVDTNKLTIIDFGGGAGTHYFIAKSVLSEAIKLDWRIVETKAMVAEAKKQGLECEELRFFDSIDTACGADEVDLVFASGSVHYTAKPYETLTKLASINAKRLILTRTPIADSPCVLLQRSTLSANGVGDIPKELSIKDKVLSYPTTMMDRHQVETILSNFGEVILKITEDKSAYVSQKGSYDLWGYIVKKV